jgi:hypothetical protein
MWVAWCSYEVLRNSLSNYINEVRNSIGGRGAATVETKTIIKTKTVCLYVSSHVLHECGMSSLQPAQKDVASAILETCSERFLSSHGN